MARHALKLDDYERHIVFDMSQQIGWPKAHGYLERIYGLTDSEATEWLQEIESTRGEDPVAYSLGYISAYISMGISGLRAHSDLLNGGIRGIHADEALGIVGRTCVIHDDEGHIYNEDGDVIGIDLEVTIR